MRGRRHLFTTRTPHLPQYCNEHCYTDFQYLHLHLAKKNRQFFFIKLVTFSFAFFLYVYQAMLSILYHLNFNVFQPLERESVHVKIDVINDFEHVAEINGTSSRCD